MNSTILVAGTIILAMAAFFLFTSGGQPAGPGEYDSFAKCLTDKGFVMYGTEWCSHCKDQKSKFGSSFQYIDFVDCDKQSSVCDLAGVSGYPTWKFEGRVLRGTQRLQVLSDIASCELSGNNTSE